MVPELNGSPKVFTIKISVLPKKDKVYGNKNLNTKNKITTTITLASIKFLSVTSLYFLK